MRIAAKAKAGFYPTPQRVVELIQSRIAGVGDLLDPCAGEGDAIKALSTSTQCRALAIELSQTRAARCREKGLQTQQGDSLQYEGGSFGLLYLNPPYDDGEGERLEYTFLKHWTPALRPGGLLVYLVPERILPRVADFLTAWYDDLRAVRFPEPEYQAFKQIVVFGKKREALSTPESLQVQGVLETGKDWRYWFAGGRGWLIKKTVPVEEALALASKSPLWEPYQSRTLEAFRPLLPLKQAHLALLIAGGIMDNQVVNLDGMPHLIKGQVQKTETFVEEEEEDGGTKTVTRERFEVQVIALNMATAEILEVS